MKDFVSRMWNDGALGKVVVVFGAAVLAFAVGTLCWMGYMKFMA